MDNYHFDQRRVAAAGTSLPPGLGVNSVFALGASVQQDSTEQTLIEEQPMPKKQEQSTSPWPTPSAKKQRVPLKTRVKAAQHKAHATPTKTGRKPPAAAVAAAKGPKVRQGTMRHRLLQTLDACGDLNTDGISEAMGITIKQAGNLAHQMASAKLITFKEVDGRKFYAVPKTGFKHWLAKKEAAAQPPAGAVAQVAAKSVAKAAEPAVIEPTGMRCALFSDGALRIEKATGNIELDHIETRALLSYLERSAGALAKA